MLQAVSQPVWFFFAEAPERIPPAPAFFLFVVKRLWQVEPRAEPTLLSGETFTS
jgi:hypothetical protein